ncbi:MAG: DUF4062 domain-containing protein [Ruminococcus sp.]|nr:DUF4062 domain-containing protein [Ruminococcus sp.]
MNKKYQVFISSTKKDLEEERMNIMQALLESQCIPAGMELFASANKKSWEIIKQDIDESDFYLLVIAGMYGSMTKDQISYTEKEYNYAIKNKKPIMVFIYKDINKLPAGKVEKTQRGKKRLENFKKRILNSGMQVSFWNNSGELVSQIKTSIQELIRNTPSAGWVKGTDLNKEGITPDFISKIGNFNDWGISKIFKTRAEKNAESDPMLETHNVKILDGIAFGLSSFRSNREYDVLQCLQNGMKMRLLVMDPNTEFVKQRAIEEKVHIDSICDSIFKLVEWVNKLNQQSTNGKIEIKYYNAMTLDFYWRVDNVVYVGPYMYNIVSQQTITAKFLNGGKGFNMYTNYFDSLWNDQNLSQYPSNFII